MSNGDVLSASTLLEKLTLPDGDAQIAMIHLANCYSRISLKEKASLTYELAMEAERVFKLKRPLEDSKFILLYCEFFLFAFKPKDTYDAKQVMCVFEQLISLKVSGKLSGLLPLPNRSELGYFLQKVD